LTRQRRLDSALLFLIACALVGPLFRLKYLNNWGSIESTFIADGRMLSENLPHPGWQPLWYCGTRFDYIYPPALRYGTAIVSQVGHVTSAKAYHIYTAFYYGLGIVAVYWMVIAATKSRGSAWLAALATATVSPVFWLLDNYRHDSHYWVPQRLHVLMSYGEGPHISALSILPAALGAAFLAVRSPRPRMLALAAILSALVVTNNFYGATSLAIFFPLLVFSIWTGQRTWRVWGRAAAIAVLAYGLTAWWLTPSYIRITSLNLQWVTHPSHGWSYAVLAIVAALYFPLSFRAGRGRPDRDWHIFLTGGVVFLSVYVLGLFYFDLRVVGDANRLGPELDLVLTLGFVAIVHALWRRQKWRGLAVILTVLWFVPATVYLRHAWEPFHKNGSIESQYEYQITKWVHDHLPRERVLPSGTVRYWFDAWFNNAQPDGGSAQGMLNQIVPVATWQIEAEKRGETAVLWLQALGTDAAVVPDKTSPEGYHDYQHPYKFQGLLPVLFDDGHGTVVYRVPRLYPGLGRVVDPSQIAAVGRIRAGDDAETLARYVSIVEDPSQPETRVIWHGTDEAEIEATTSTAQAVLFQETYDPAWRAYECGRALPVTRDPVIGFMLIGAAEGTHTIRMRFETPLENRVGQVVFGAAVIAILGLVVFGSPRET
jgi:hypothetical protein